jgi:hypothetical protein
VNKLHIILIHISWALFWYISVGSNFLCLEADAKKVVSKARRKEKIGNQLVVDAQSSNIALKMKVKGTKKLVMMKTLKMERMTEMVIMNAVKIKSETKKIMMEMTTIVSVKKMIVMKMVKKTAMKMTRKKMRAELMILELLHLKLNTSIFQGRFMVLPNKFL